MARARTVAGAVARFRPRSAERYRWNSEMSLQRSFAGRMRPEEFTAATRTVVNP
jgi:hypothetical protein